MSTTNIIGRKIKGFEFPDLTDRITYDHDMDKYIGVVGEITEYGDIVPSLGVTFPDGETWFYPLSLIEQHLVPEEKPAINSDQTLTPRCSLHWDEPCDGGSNCNTVCWIQSGNKGRIRRMHYAAYAIGDVTYCVNTQQYSLTIYGENGDMIFYGQDANEVDSRAQSFVNAEAYRVENERLRKALKRALELLVDIDSTLFHHNHEVMGWHKNDAGEPIMNFVSDFDMDAIKEIESALSQNT